MIFRACGTTRADGTCRSTALPGIMAACPLSAFSTSGSTPRCTTEASRIRPSPALAAIPVPDRSRQRIVPLPQARASRRAGKSSLSSRQRSSWPSIPTKDRGPGCPSPLPASTGGASSRGKPRKAARRNTPSPRASTFSCNGGRRAKESSSRASSSSRGKPGGKARRPRAPTSSAASSRMARWLPSSLRSVAASQA